jgi:hypothetical protein
MLALASLQDALGSKSGRTPWWKISLRAQMAALRTLADDQAIALATAEARRAAAGVAVKSCPDAKTDAIAPREQHFILSSRRRVDAGSGSPSLWCSRMAIYFIAVGPLIIPPYPIAAFIPSYGVCSRPKR